MNKLLAGCLAVSACTLTLISNSCLSASAEGEQVDMHLTHEALGNPYLPLWEHLPDGEPRVFEDPDNPGKYRVYIIGSHDVNAHSYCGVDVRAWSAPVEDLTQWRDEGPIFTYCIDGRWDTMYAPDLVEVNRRDGTREYYLYPHSHGAGREPMVCKGTRPDGPFTPVNVSEDGKNILEGSILGFDPSVFIDYIDDPEDPDYEIGFRAYGFWGFQGSNAAQLDQNTMYSKREGTEVIRHFIPASTREGAIREPEGTEYPCLFPGEDLKAYNFFEASSIRKVGNKYVLIYSGYSGPEYGIDNSNSTLRYAYGDSPLGPWKSGGVLVDSRAPQPNYEGSAMVTTNSGHNTHGSIEKINDQWYVFYHRPPRSFGFARQSVVAPITIVADETPVAEGGKVVITGYDPYLTDNVLTAKTSNGKEYTGAEVTSEGFNIYGMDPYKYYSAGYACYFSDCSLLQDAWDVWNNHMTVANVKNNDIVGFKYFGFGGLQDYAHGLKPFEGTHQGNGTAINVFIEPLTQEEFALEVWMDGPFDTPAWSGKKIGEIKVAPASEDGGVVKYTADVADKVDNLDGKHAIYLIPRGKVDAPLMDLYGLGFSRKGLDIEMPVVPTVEIMANGEALEVPANPTRATNFNGITDYSIYTVECPCQNGETPVITARCSNPDVVIAVEASDNNEIARVNCDYHGMIKTFVVKQHAEPQTETMAVKR